jgi:hypothetical protein
MIQDETVKKDLLLEMYKENTIQGRHHEIQRANVTSSLIAIDAVLIGLVTFDKEISRVDIPLTGLLTLLGFFGAMFVAKHYERFELHMKRAKHYRNAIDELFEGKPIRSLKKEADAEHAENFTRIRQFRLSASSLILHLLVAALGIILTIVAGFFPQKVV